MTIEYTETALSIGEELRRRKAARKRMRAVDDDGEGHPDDHDTARSIGAHLRRLRRLQGEPARPAYDQDVQEEAARRREIKKSRKRDREGME